ncbi:Methyltransferase domain-containing protein [Franzmannia pantelleriensis]|uniref:Methyltransferase domain-containing protein n=1 Tax=Franzmannia pantelleriensis TaxID=48727 RepID=A0A1G9USM6_9GAMM|nr:methyltransferase domain-containing protein [Halomonas pantelleriensis]SDM62565.1 Methyltransferase domain-containing protein [Halomonas pantelleriensis]
MAMSHEAFETRIRPHNATPSAVWSSGGGTYDEISRGIMDAIEHTIDRLDPKPGMRVLDVATGTGWGARRLAERGCHVTGVDFATDMLAHARERAAARGLDIDFQHGDAEALPFEDAAFDAVISTFGVMFVQRPEDAAAELARVCRPGGRLALAVWTPDGNVFEMFKVIKEYMPPPDGTPPPSPFEWGDPARVRQLLGNAFDLHFENGVSYYRKPDGLAAWQVFSEGYGPVRTLATSLESTQRERFAEDFIAFHQAFVDEMGITVPREYRVVGGMRIG